MRFGFVGLKENVLERVVCALQLHLNFLCFMKTKYIISCSQVYIISGKETYTENVYCIIMHACAMLSKISSLLVKVNVIWLCFCQYLNSYQTSDISAIFHPIMYQYSSLPLKPLLCRNRGFKPLYYWPDFKSLG
jgi:hypothetical protein